MPYDYKMGVNSYSTSLNLVAKNSEILEAVKEWLDFNEFKMTEHTPFYIKAKTGKYLAIADRNLRRYIEIKLSEGLDIKRL